MKVNVTFFATFREIAGTSNTIVNIDGDTIGDVIDVLIKEHGNRFKNELMTPDGNLIKHVKVLRNGTFLDRNAPLKNPVKEGDTIAFLPPIIGG